jgi:hypothetical protein
VTEQAFAQLFAHPCTDPASDLNLLDEPHVAAASVICDLPTRMEPACETTISVFISNDGDRSLASIGSRPIHLASYWICADGQRLDGARTVLRRPLPPGEWIETSLILCAPTDTGAHRLTVSLVQEGVAWFDEIDPAHGVSGDITVAAHAVDHERDSAGPAGARTTAP